MLLELPSLGFQPRYYTAGAERFHLPLLYDLVVRCGRGQIVTLGYGDGPAHFTFCQAVQEHQLAAKCFAVHRSDAAAELESDEQWRRGRAWS